jgi:hypothetical protein
VFENVEHKDLSGLIIHSSDQPVSIIRDVEDRPASNDIRPAERGPEFGEIVPNTSPHSIVPSQETSFRIRMMWDKLFDPLQRDNMQYVMFSYLRTTSKLRRSRIPFGLLPFELVNSADWPLGYNEGYSLKRFS